MNADRDPATGRFASAIDNALKLATGVIGIYMVARLVLPGNQTAAVINAMGSSFAAMVKVATAENAIAVRDIPRVERLLGEMDNEVMAELFAGLSDADLDWVESHLTMGVE